MKKKTWIKPNFELELFVPNHYIGGCNANHHDDPQYIVTLSSELDPSNKYWIDFNGNGEVDGHEIVNGRGTHNNCVNFFTAYLVHNGVPDYSKEYYLSEGGHGQANSYYVGDQWQWNVS